MSRQNRRRLGWRQRIWYDNFPFGPGGRTFLQRPSPGPPPWRLLPGSCLLETQCGLAPMNSRATELTVDLNHPTITAALCRIYRASVEITLRQKQSRCEARGQGGTLRCSNLFMNEILLRVEGRGFVAGAVFRKDGKKWFLVRCAPILGWMRGVAMNRLKQNLSARNLQWKWL